LRVILGIAPGLAALGYGVIVVDGPRLTLRAHGVLTTACRSELGVGRNPTVRLGELARDFADLSETYRPQAAALEELRYDGKAIGPALQVANVAGMVREALRARGVTTTEYSARDIKLAVAGDANASEAEVEAAVQRHLRLRAVPRPTHAAGALAAAIAHTVHLPRIAEEAAR